MTCDCDRTATNEFGSRERPQAYQARHHSDQVRRSSCSNRNYVLTSNPVVGRGARQLFLSHTAISRRSGLQGGPKVGVHSLPGNRAKLDYAMVLLTPNIRVS